MIDSTTYALHLENVTRLSKIEERIIGIDGNGTGREGALQRQDKKLLDLETAVESTNTKLDLLVHRSESWSKAEIWSAVKWMFGIILTCLALIMSYLGYRASQHAADPVAHTAVHALNDVPTDAKVE